jgi:Tfp pilus assembly ATPase PilU
MQTLNQSLAELYRTRKITLETAMTISSNVEELKDLVGRRDSAAGSKYAGAGANQGLGDSAITSSRRMSITPRGGSKEG